MTTELDAARLDALAALYETSEPGNQGHLLHVAYTSLPALIALARKALETERLVRAPYEDGSVMDSWEKLEILYAVSADDDDGGTGPGAVSDGD